MSKTDKKTRKTYALDPVVVERILRLQEKTECTNQTEVIRRALALYELAVDRAKGNQTVKVAGVEVLL